MAEQIGLEAILVTDQFNKGVKQYNNGLVRMSKNTKGTASAIGGQMAGLGKSVLKVGAIAGGAALVGVAALGAGMAALGVASVSTAISFESAFAGVIKTTDGLTDSVGNLTAAGTELRAGFVGLSKEVPLAFEELAAIGELGGQLGIGKDALLDFTETVAGLGVATNLSTEEAATGLARMSNIYNVAAEDMGTNIEQLGSTIVALGNNFATTERDILSFGERIAGAGSLVGLAQSEVLAIGAAMSSVGVEAEAGGTAVQKVLLGINNAVNSTATGFVDYTKQIDANVKKLTDLNAESARLEAIHPGLQAEMLATREAFLAAGGTAEDFGRQLGDKTRQGALETAMAIQELTDKTNLMRAQQGQPIDAGALQKFASVAGLSADEFTEAWETDAAGAFQLFVEGLADEGDNAVNVLNDLGMADQRLIRSFLSLAGAGGLLGEAIDLGNKAFEENTALAKEAAQRYATTESQIAMLKNTFRAIGDQIGSRVLPYLNQLIGLGKDLVDKWAGPITDAIQNNVIPAIDAVINKISGLVQTFQSGGLFGAGAGSSFGSAGLLAALGFSPEAVVLVEGIFNSITQSFQAFQDGLGVGEILQPFADLLQTQWDTLIVPKLQEWATQFMDWAYSVIPEIPAALSGIMTALTSYLTEQGPAIQETLHGWAMTFWNWVETAAMGAGAALAVVLSAVVAWATSAEAGAQLNAAGVAMGEMLVTGISNLAEEEGRMGAIMLAIAGGLLAATAAIAGTLIIIGGQIVAGILEGIIESITGGDIEVATFSELSGILTNIGNDILTIAQYVGENIITGISEGLADYAPILTAVGEAVKYLTDEFKSLLGISSPSTIFFDFGLDIIQGLIDGIASMAGQVLESITGLFGNLDIGSLLGGATEGVGGLLSGLFGGGEGETEGMDFSGITTGLAEIGPAILLVQEQFTTLGEVTTEITTALIEVLMLLGSQILAVDLAIQNIYLVTLPTLLAVFTATTQTMIQMLILTTQTVLQLDLTIQNVYLVTLPVLQSVTVTTAQIMIDAFLSVIPVVEALVTLVEALVTKLQEASDAATKMADAIVEGFEDSADAIEDFIGLVEDATSAVNKLGAAMGDAVRASGGIPGALMGMGLGKVLSSGIGFQHGSPGFNTGLGWTVPGGFPNDEFPLRVSSGEEIIVTPPGVSMDSVISQAIGRMGGGGTTKIVNVSIPNVTIYDGTDYNTLVATIRQEVAGAF